LVQLSSDFKDVATYRKSM